MKSILVVVWLGSIVGLMLGCSSATSMFKADPAPPSGFIEDPEKMTEMRHHAPFHALWFKDRKQFDETRAKFKKIYFAPVSTEFVLSKGWWDELNTADRALYDSELREMGNYMRKAFNEAFENDPNERFEITDAPDSETVVYEIALVELVATKAHINAAGTAIGAMVPGGGLVKATAKGSVAIEVKVIDGENGDVIITWADREQDQSSLFNFNDFSWYSHARKAVDTWADQLVQLHNTTTEDLVEDSSPFTLSPL